MLGLLQNLNMFAYTKACYFLKMVATTLIFSTGVYKDIKYLCSLNFMCVSEFKFKIFYFY